MEKTKKGQKDTLMFFHYQLHVKEAKSTSNLFKLFRRTGDIEPSC